MYEFTDTADHGRQGLSAEALTFNGVCLDREIRGYRTLSVSGREILPSAITALETGADGQFFRSSRMQPRTLTVRYQILARTATEYREIFNQIMAVLSAPQSQIVVADEPDKYFIGSLADAAAPEPGRNAVTGEFSLICSDPLKYSLAETSFKAVTEDGSMTMAVANGGTVPAAISLEITHNDENGYISITDGTNYLEFGDRVEPDEEERILSGYAIRNWETYETPSYVDNNYTTQSDVTTAGTWGLDSNLLYGKNYGPDITDKTKHWRGCTRSYTLTKPEGLPNMQNWLADWCLYFNYSKPSQRGLMWLAVLTEENAMIAGIRLLKDQTTSMAVSVQMWVRGLNYVKKITVNNVMEAIGEDSRHIKIQKSGDVFTFTFGGKTYSFVSPEMAAVDAGKFLIGAYAYKDDGAANQIRIRFQGLWFRVDGSYLYDLPNRFPAGSVCTVDGSRQEFSVDGSYHPQDELIGSVYFKVPPGETMLTFQFSDFCTELPEVKGTIREAWV